MKDWSKAELNRLYRYALALNHVPDEACDLVQHALLRWLETDTRQVKTPLTYVMRTIRNLHFDRHRHTQRWDERSLEGSELVSLQGAALEDLLIREDEVAALLAQLCDSERELLYLWAVEGYTVDEIRTLQGGRYCSVQSVPAAQLRYRDGANQPITVYQAPYDAQRHGSLPSRDLGEASLRLHSRGVEVELWTERGLLMATAVSAEPANQD